ncbi:hypothetical protein LguiA_012134 [Lonicera macranthoides]
MAPKRIREEEEDGDGDIKALTMKLKGLKRTKEDEDFSKLSWLLSRMEKQAARTFKCKTCDRVFDSFQALGGHRASHSAKSDDPLKNRRSHVCKECGAEFSKGQALGGHMRKHRDTSPSPTTSEEMSSDLTPRVDVAVSNISSSKRVLRSLDINLNLVPSEESDEEDYQPLEDSKLKNYDADENNSELNHDEESEEDSKLNNYDADDNNSKLNHDEESEENSKLKNYDADENNLKLNHDVESEEEDYSKSMEEENYPTENYELDENNSKLKHDDLPIEEEKLINEWKYKKINLEPQALQERDLNIKYYYFLDE